MDTKKLLLGTIVGGIVLFLTGYLMYGLLLMDFFQSHAGTATGVPKEAPDLAILFVGELFFSFLLTYIYLKWANISTFVTGAKAGALIGLLIGFHFSLIYYATMNISDLTATLVDPFVGMIMVSITGGVVGWLIGMGNNS